MTRQRSDTDRSAPAAKKDSEAQIAPAELSEDELQKATGGSKSSSEPHVSEITISKRSDKGSTNLF